MADPGYLPGPKIIPLACQVVLNWSLTDAKVGHNVLYVSYAGTPPLDVDLANTIMTGITAGGGFWTQMAGFLAATVSLQSVTLTDVRSLTGQSVTSTAAAAPGTSSGTALPDEVALGATVTSLVRGPSGRGRFYLPGWASNAAGPGGVVAAGAVSAAQGWVSSTLFNTLTGSLGAPGIALAARQAYTSPDTGREFPARTASLLDATAYIIKDNHWDTQRRRGLR